MKKNIIILSLVSVGAIVLLVVLFIIINIQPKSTLNAVLSSDTTQDESKIIAGICNATLGTGLYSKNEILSLHNCGSYLTLNPNLDDGPSVVYDKNGNFITYCGGLSDDYLKNSTPKECLLKCDTKNLCSNSSTL